MANVSFRCQLFNLCGYVAHLAFIDLVSLMSCNKTFYTRKSNVLLRGNKIQTLTTKWQTIDSQNCPIVYWNFYHCLVEEFAIASSTLHFASSSSPRIHVQISLPPRIQIQASSCSWLDVHSSHADVTQNHSQPHHLTRFYMHFHQLY